MKKFRQSLQLGFVSSLFLCATSLVLIAKKESSANSKELVKVEDAVVAKPLTPVQISAQLRASLANVKDACVGVYSHGSASGVIISEDGLVMTAAHVVVRIKEGQKITISLEDGRKFSAKKLGSNVESDIGLLRIENPDKVKFPFVKLADKSAQLGECIFTYSHPSGELKGRPAQVRVGRVVSVVMKDKKPLFIFSDLNIQPGDSGGPLLNLAGDLVGVNSSAANIPGFNIFSAIDQYHIDIAKLLEGENFGDPKLSPMNGSHMLTATFNKSAIAKIEKEVLRRYKLKHAKTVDFLEKSVNAKGEVVLNNQQLVNLSARDAIAIANNRPVSMGLDDPDMINQLPKIKPPHFYTLGLVGKVPHVEKPQQKKTKGQKKEAKGKTKPEAKKVKLVRAVTRGVALDKNLILFKASEFNRFKDRVLKVKSGDIKLTEKNVVKRSKELDLLIVKLPKKLNVTPIKFASKSAPVKAGQLLIAPDSRTRPIWNIATDERRVVAKNRSIGPLKNKNLISKHRSPYPFAIRHALPLFASDACTPVFDDQGDFVGVHIARFSRTMGLVIPQDLVKEFYQSYLKEQKKPAK